MVRVTTAVLAVALAVCAVACGGAASASPDALEWPEVEMFNPVADPSATVVSGHARFTVLTPRLIRMQYAAGSTFEDRATLAVVNRNLPVPNFKSSTTADVLTITTSDVELTYAIGQPFSGATLSVASLDKTSKFTGWAFGDRDDGNLLGTIKSLDQLGVISLNCTENANVTVHSEQLHCHWGLVSRGGWAVVNDTTSPALNPTTGWWNDGNTTDIVDMYLFAHGHDYMGALGDYTKIGGNIIMPPRATMGVWWSRWHNINNRDSRAVVENYRSRGLPLDGESRCWPCTPSVVWLLQALLHPCVWCARSHTFA